MDIQELRVGDEVWVRAVVTSVKPNRVGIGVRIAARVGSSYAGSSPKNARVIDGVVYRTVEAPREDVRHEDLPVVRRDG